MWDLFLDSFFFFIDLQVYPNTNITLYSLLYLYKQSREETA